MKLTEVHNEILNHLLESGIHFKPRKINRDKRLEQGYWFLGNKNYINIGFWSGKDWYRKINNIGFTIEFNKQKDVFLCLSARQDDKVSNHLSAIAKIVGANKDEKSIDLWTKIYSSGVNTINDYKSYLDEFLNRDRILINNYIANNQTPFNKISSPEFDKSIQRIFEYKNDFDVVQPDLEISKVKKTIKQGKREINIEKHLRVLYERKIEIRPIHKELQLKFKSEFEDDKGVEIIFEENNIDIKVIRGDEIHLYEVKTSNSPISCIRQGLGQLLFYLSQNFYDNVTKIFIAGPGKPNDNDLEFINFLKKTLEVKFDYIQIA